MSKWTKGYNPVLYKVIKTQLEWETFYATEVSALNVERLENNCTSIYDPITDDSVGYPASYPAFVILHLDFHASATFITRDQIMELLGLKDLVFSEHFKDLYAWACKGPHGGVADAVHGRYKMLQPVSQSEPAPEPAQEQVLETVIEGRDV